MLLDRKILSLIDLHLQERLEQVIVRASSSEHKKQLAMFHTVDQQPVTFKVNFSVSFPVSHAMHGRDSGCVALHGFVA